MFETLIKDKSISKHRLSSVADQQSLSKVLFVFVRPRSSVLGWWLFICSRKVVVVGSTRSPTDRAPFHTHNTIMTGALLPLGHLCGTVFQQCTIVQRGHLLQQFQAWS